MYIRVCIPWVAAGAYTVWNNALSYEVRMNQKSNSTRVWEYTNMDRNFHPSLVPCGKVFTISLREVAALARIDNAAASRSEIVKTLSKEADS